MLMVTLVEVENHQLAPEPPGTQFLRNLGITNIHGKFVYKMQEEEGLTVVITGVAKTTSMVLLV